MKTTIWLALLIFLIGPPPLRAADAPAPFAGAAALDDAELDASRARGFESVVHLSGGVESNAIGASVTGHNTIELPGFAGQGVFTFVQNSGNNVLLQTATVVNITVH